MEDSDKVVKIEIRKVDEEELHAVRKIEQGIYDTPWSFNFFRLMANLAKDLFLVALREGDIVGYTVGELVSRTDLKKAGHVMNLAVKKTYRKEGIGTMLIDELECRFKERGAEIAYLEVRESNLDAQRLYKGRGFVFQKKIRNYYGDEDAYVMTKKLV